MVLPYQHPWKSLAFGIALGLAILGVCYAVLEETALQMATRWTGRASALLFLPVFIARPLVDLFGGKTAGPLLRHRSGIGLTLAGNHHVHMVLLTIYLLGEGRSAASLFANPGLYIYFALIAMNVTSFPRLARALPRPLVRWIHFIGLYALAIAFFETLILSQFMGEETGVFRMAYAAVFFVGLLVRLVAGVKRGRVGKAEVAG